MWCALRHTYIERINTPGNPYRQSVAGVRTNEGEITSVVRFRGKRDYVSYTGVLIMQVAIQKPFCILFPFKYLYDRNGVDLWNKSISFQ